MNTETAMSLGDIFNSALESGKQDGFIESIRAISKLSDIKPAGYSDIEHRAYLAALMDSVDAIRDAARKS